MFSFYDFMNYFKFKLLYFIGMSDKIFIYERIQSQNVWISLFIYLKLEKLIKFSVLFLNLLLLF